MALKLNSIDLLKLVKICFYKGLPANPKVESTNENKILSQSFPLAIHCPLSLL